MKPGQEPKALKKHLLGDLGHFDEGGVAEPPGLDEFLQTPVNIPGTQGLDPSQPPQAFLGQVLDKTIGSGPQTSDSIEPDYNSPIDLAAGALGSRLGEGGTEILGNEIGAVGRNVGKNTTLPMDEASRMQRAKEMGFDTDKVWYHGTTTDFKAFEPSEGNGSGVIPEGSEGYSFFTNKPNVANDFADHNIRNLNQAYETQKLDPEFWEPFRQKIKSKLAAKYPDLNKRELELATDDRIEQLDRDAPWVTEQWAEKQLGPPPKPANEGVIYPTYLKNNNQHIVKPKKGEKVFDTLERGFSEANKKNAESILFKNIADSPGFNQKSDVVAVKNPSQIRSKFATFNPKKAKSAGLSESKGGLIPGYVDGGTVAAATDEPPGLDQFIAGQPASTAPVDTASQEPAGLDEFIAPELQQEKYGSIGEQLKTGLEGAAEGVIGPFAPMIEKSLGAKDEDIQARREANPGVHALGEIGGLGASMLTGVGEGALAVKMGKAAAGLAGLGDVAKAEALASKLKTSVSALEEAGLVPRTTTAAKIGSAATKGAIENMVIQGGDELSKMVINDPNQSVQTSVSALGLSGLIGGAFGTAGGLWGATVGKKVGDTLNSLAQKAGGIDGVTPDAVTQALDTLGVQASPEVRAGLSSDPELRSAFDNLQAATSSSGKKAQASYQQFKNDITDSLLTTVGKNAKDLSSASDLSDFEAGQSIKKTLTDELKSVIDPISKDFEQVKNKYKDIGLPEAARTDIAEQLGNLSGVEGYGLSPESAQAKLINRIYRELPNLNTLEDMRKYGSIISDAASNTPELYRLGGQIRHIFRGMEDSLVDRALSENAPELLAKHADARTAYKAAMTTIDELNDRLHVGRYHGPSSFINAMKDMAPEDIVRRLSPKGDAGIIGTLSTKFPQTAQELRNVYLDKVLSKAVDKAAPGERLAIPTFFREFNKLSPEMRSFLVGGNEGALPKMQAIEAIADQLPNKAIIAPQGIVDKAVHYLPGSATAIASMLMGHHAIISGVIGGLTQKLANEIPDAVRLSLLKFLGTNREVSAKGFKAMVDMFSGVIKGDALLSRAAKNLFRSGSEVLPQSYQVTDNERKKLDKQLKHIQTNPNGLLVSNDHLNHYLPDMGQSIAQLTATAAQYLNGMRPDKDIKAPLDRELPVSPAARASFDRALTIAQQPLSILSRVKAGTVSPQEIEILNSLYPSLYAKVRTKVMDELITHVNKGQTVPYQTRMGLSLFLAQPLDSTLTPQAIMAAQSVMQANQRTPAQQPPPPGAKSSPALQKMPTLYQTPAQTRAQRHQKM